MVKQRKAGGLTSKLGAAGRKAFEECRDDKTTYGAGADLPAGIEAGVAQLVECKFSQYAKGDNVGEYFLYAAGVVFEPAEVAGIPVRGLRTSITEPMCNTPTRTRQTVQDHVKWVRNEMAKLGIDTRGSDVDDFEAFAAALKKEQPFFRFRTWKGTKQTEGPYAGREPRVQEEWRGACDYVASEEDDVADDTAEDQEAETQDPLGEAADTGDEDAIDQLTTMAKDAGLDPDEFTSWTELDTALKGHAPEEEEQEEEEEEVDDIPFEEMAVKADAGDEPAKLALAEAAEAAGIDPEEIETWAEVAEAISEASPDDASEGEEEEEEEEKEENTTPEKGEVWFFKPPRARKRLECEVTAVFPGKETCNLRSLDDNKVFKGVLWSALSNE